MDLNTVESVLFPRDRAALAVLEQGDAILGGGTWLFSEPQPGVRRLVDLVAMGWPALSANADGLEIAATCRIAELNAWTAPPGWPATALIPQCCRALLGSFKIWNTATVGGNLCLALPAGPMTALGAALDGVCTIWTPDGGERRLPVRDFVLGDSHNALAPFEVLRAIHLPAHALRRRVAFRQISLNPDGRSAVLLIGTRQTGAFALTLTAATPHPVQLDFATHPGAPELRDGIEARVTARGLWFDDVHGAPDWRRLVSLHLAEQIRQELSCG